MKEKAEFMREALAREDPDAHLFGGARSGGKPAPVVPFSDWDYYYTFDSLHWNSDAPPDRQVDVPGGFVTDLASIPRVFWIALPRTAKYTYPAIFHDYLYWEQTCSRKEADDILRTIMVEFDVEKVQVHLIYDAVRVFGKGPWAANRAARERGERRILRKFPPSMTVTWDAWKATEGVFSD